MTSLYSFLILLTPFMAKILFANDFYAAWKYVPPLLMYIVFNTLSGLIGGIFSATMESKKLATSGIIGAIVNVVLNFILIYFVGTMGAAIATLISSVVIWYLRLKTSQNNLYLNVNYLKYNIQYMLLFIQGVLLVTIYNTTIKYSLQCVILAVILMQNIIEIKKVRNNII